MICADVVERVPSTASGGGAGTAEAHRADTERQDTGAGPAHRGQQQARHRSETTLRGNRTVTNTRIGLQLRVR